MKATILILAVILGVNLAEAQTKKVREKDLDGIWQMKITLKDGFLEEDIRNEDNAFARVILQATGNFVEGIIGEIDVKFEFLAEGKCRVYASAFGEDSKVEYTRWWITERGELYIDDADSYSSSDDDFWLFEDDVLVMHNKRKNDDDAQVILYRID